MNTVDSNEWKSDFALYLVLIFPATVLYLSGKIAFFCYRSNE